MNASANVVSRRRCLQAAAGATMTVPWAGVHSHAARADKVAQVAITLDLEMSRNFPTWESTHWDYEKGNLNAETKQYTVKAAQRVHDAGGKLHCFVVGRVLEQPNVDWLKGILKAGHLAGNHTYDHVNLTADTMDAVQYRFRRAPWLVTGRPPAEVIEENVRLCSLAMTQRLGVAPAGFRTPGGFSDGLKAHAEVRNMLKRQGFTWISSLYPRHRNSEPMQKPSEAVLQSIVDAHAAGQPFRYDDGLVEIPMSPISDIGAFRTGRWKLPWFLESIRRTLAWTIENGGVFDFLGHPSCLYVVDPKFEVIELICRMVRDAGDRARLVDLNQIAARVK